MASCALRVRPAGAARAAGAGQLIGRIRDDGRVAPEETRITLELPARGGLDFRSNEDEFAGETRLFPAGGQQNVVGSTGSVPGPEAGGLGSVRDGVVSK